MANEWSASNFPPHFSKLAHKIGILLCPGAGVKLAACKVERTNFTNFKPLPEALARSPRAPIPPFLVQEPKVSKLIAPKANHGKISYILQRNLSDRKSGISSIRPLKKHSAINTRILESGHNKEMYKRLPLH